MLTGFEGSLRIPFARRWPVQIAAGTSSKEIVHQEDLFPTFARIAGDAIFSEKRDYVTPRLHNLLADAKESEKVISPHTRVPKAALVRFEEQIASLKAHPPIKPATLDPYQPSKPN